MGTLVSYFAYASDLNIQGWKGIIKAEKPGRPSFPFQGSEREGENSPVLSGEMEGLKVFISD